MNERAQQLAADIEADGIDRVRDRQFYQEPERYMSPSDMDELVGVLVDTDDDLEVGLSQIGIDPYAFDEDDLQEIEEELNEHGVYFDGDTWTNVS